MKFWDELSEPLREMIQTYRAIVEKAGLKGSLETCILEDGVPVPADFLTCSLWMDSHPELCDIGKDTIKHYEVSTVFCCTPLGRKNKKPCYFETMIYKHGDTCESYRYHTLKEAQDGHAVIINQLRSV